MKRGICTIVLLFSYLLQANTFVLACYDGEAVPFCTSFQTLKEYGSLHVPPLV